MFLKKIIYIYISYTGTIDILRRNAFLKMAVIKR